MKKGLIVGALVVTMLLGTFAVYADTVETQSTLPFGRQGNRFLRDRAIGQSLICNLSEEEKAEFLKEKENFFKERENLSQEEREEWFKERTEFRRQAIKEALKDGKITEEQAKTFEEKLQEKEEFHKENGFNNAGGNGQGFGMGKKDGQGRGQGQGRDMKKGHRL